MKDRSSRTLGSEYQQRLAEVLDEYLCVVERGERVDVEELVKRHPDLEAPIREYLPSLAWLRDGFSDFQDVEGYPGGNSSITSAPRQLGDYELLREIGRGGMGVVYEARQSSLDRHVALKVLPFAAVLDRKQILRFQNEARAAAQLHHPNIVPIHGVGSDRGVHYYAMQFIEGQSLRQAIDELRDDLEMDDTQSLGNVKSGSASCRLSVSTCRVFSTGRGSNPSAHMRASAKLGLQAAEAIQAAHDCGVIHRDVKPSNLLLDEQGKLWITDFGLARTHMDANVTASGDVLGTLHYMSPEQAQGHSALVDHRSDIYSLGVTLYELLTFHRPFSGTAHAEVLRQIECGEYKRLRHWNASIPRDLENVVAKAMASSREDRYDTAQEMADDLARFLDGKPTHAQPPTVTQRVTKWTRRHQRSVAAACLVGVLALASLAAGIVMLAREQSKTDQALAQSRVSDQLARHRLQLATENLAEARSAVDELGARATELLGSVPGTEHARQKMLESVLRYHERLLQQQDDSPELQADKAISHAKMAKIHEQLGNDLKALREYEESRKLFTKLASQPDNHALSTKRLATCLNNLGLLIARLGDVDKARDTLREAIALQAQLISADPQQQESTADLALSWNNLGLIHADAGDADAALSSYQSAVRLLTAESADSLGDELTLQTLATTYRNLSLLAVGEDLESAIDWCKQALSIRRRLVESQPANLEFMAELATCYSSLASLYAKMPTENTLALIQAHGDAAALQRKLVEQQPFRIDRRRELAITLNNRGLAQTRQRRTADAQQSFLSAIKLQTELVRQLPGDHSCRSQLGGMHNNLAMVYQLQEKDALAVNAFRTGIRLQHDALREAPNVERFRDHLSRSYFNYGRVLRRLHRPKRAGEIALQRRKLWNHDPVQLLSVAEELAWASQNSPGQSKQAQRFKTEAIKTMKQAATAGWKPKPEFRETVVFEVLEAEPEFRQLMTTLQLSSSPEAELKVTEDQS